MKKLILLISGIVLSATVSTTSAQQLPNYDFEKWERAGYTYQSNKEGSKGSAYGDIQRPDNEPVSWEGSSVHQKVFYMWTQEKEQTLVTQGTDNAVLLYYQTAQTNTSMIQVNIGSVIS